MGSSATRTVICLLQLVALSGHIYLEAGGVARVFVLLKRGHFVNTLRTCESTGVGHVLQSTASHGLRRRVILPKHRLLNGVFAEELVRAGVVKILVLDGN